MVYLLAWVSLGFLAVTINSLNEKYQDKWKTTNTTYLRMGTLDCCIAGFITGPLVLIAALADSYTTFVTLRKEYNERKTTNTTIRSS